ncbi:HGGxSTG domain-containing protein [Methylomonas koyamae]|uniref:HGGxSTG domain-containing protein n=1 Tax=Methylomonas koyamae TaxID=702114 RepID=UPI0035716235
MNINPMQSAHLAPRCAAYARTTGNPCRSPAMANGRCRMHGGKATGAPTGKANGNYKHGKRTQEKIDERLEIKALCRSAGQNTRYTRQQLGIFREHAKTLGVRWQKLWTLCCRDDGARR